ncbi:hypothetical protein EG347_16385 [Chryseobacterium sp. G0186]|uniref:hypothetical protein n=1 Tax=Chryseobacterium sp. G0186 TaxID=2487064 RepID=UPI000F4FF6D4|nr:hypothetical protein [Chryseobacterium sp. G0186]AZA78978.1 hypothetical protein EG347_16385 [Chryseobacterium sp. G0186]
MVKASTITKGHHEYRIYDSPVDGSVNSTDKVKYSYSTVHEFQDSYGGLSQYGVDNIYLQTPEGYGLASNGLFYEKSWWDNLWGIDTITHETGHVILNNSKYFKLAETATRNMGTYSKPLDNLGHISIRKMSIELFKMNSWLKSPWYIPEKYFYNSNSTLDNLLKKLIKPFKF